MVPGQNTCFTNSSGSRRPSQEDVAEWFVQEYSNVTSKRTTRGYLQVLRGMGLVKYLAEAIAVTPTGAELAASESLDELRRVLETKILGEPARVILLEKDHVYYIQADGDDTLMRASRKKPYAHLEPLEEVEARLPSPPFFRIHRSSVVNLDRVYELRSRGGWRVGSEDGSSG